MKKITALLLALLCAMSLMACNEKDLPDEGTTTPDPTPEVQPATVSAEYTHSFVDMALELPQGWAWEKVTEDSTDKTEGIRFYKSDDPTLDWTLLCWTGGYGICGTGIDSEALTLSNGQQVTLHTEEYADSDRVWINIVFENVPGSYVAAPYKSYMDTSAWETNRDTILDILATVQLGRKAVSESAAIEAAKALYEGEYDTVYASYDVTTGAWIVSFSQATAGSSATRVTVDAAGKAMLGTK